ncbi:hypothetical protein [Jeotgalibacillus sp. R-1-5s-1]|uniref:hypothetical protein n=1 Tax=Jeotgalibacillus sp. R-1-5s-1 TaxID=2555897 RepID=UPI00106B74AD|nr:hypothetical protein [Jeotgalibacillus sp. R-1-5s-1]TFD94460.1 hypothetical protein E2491_13575 [Jeotgalibacillus sp. R-1-5s-1]
MHRYGPGVLISIIIFLVLVVINDWYYANTGPLNAIVMVLSSYSILFPYLIEKKKWKTHLLFFLMLIVVISFSIPQVTYVEAESTVVEEYGLVDITDRGNLPLMIERWEDRINPFHPHTAYYFSGVNEDGKNVSVMVTADEKRIVEINP